MAVIKAVSSRASIAKAVKYVEQDEKTIHKLVSGIYCNPRTAIEEMKATKAFWNKTDGRQYKHFVQSFSPDEKVTPELAHKIACELAETEFKGFEVVIATHEDAEHIHTHFIVNSVNYETGKKFQQSADDLQNIKNHSDALCKNHSLSICVKGNKSIAAYEMGAYKAIQRAVEGKYKSYLLNTFIAVENARQTAVSREDFTALMKEQGFSTVWKKYITFTDKDGNKVRNTNLENKFKVDCKKETFESQFAQNLKQKELADTEQPAARPAAAPVSGDVENIDDILRDCIDKAKSVCKDRKEFQEYLQKNYNITMPRNTAKTVSFVHPSVCITVRGKKLGADYTSEAIDKVLNKNLEEDTKHQAEQTNGSVQDIAANTAPLSFYEQIKVMGGNVECDDKKLQTCLETIRDNGIQGYSDIVYKIEQLTGISRNNHRIMKELDDKNAEYKKAINYLEIYNQYLPIHKELQSKKFFKNSFIKEHQSELDAFDDAAKQLDKLGLNTNIDTEKALNLIKENSVKVTEMYEDIEATNKTIYALKEARKFIDSLTDKVKFVEEQLPDQEHRQEQDNDIDDGFTMSM